MRALATAFIVLAALATGAPAQTLKDFLEAAKVRWNAPTEPFRMIGNIHYVGTEGIAVYLITSPQGHILMDTALPEATAQIKANIVELGFKIADIKYILNTHAHLDHCGYLPRLVGQGFRGRIPLDVRGLPHGVRVLDIGLNGILVNENETRRTMVIYAEPWVRAQSHPIVVFARREGKNSEHAAKSVLLKIGSGAGQPQ